MAESTLQQIVHNYIDAWSSRDIQRLLNCFTPQGTYQDPTTGGPIQGDALANNVNGLWQAFPDLNFSLFSYHEAADNLAIFQWLMQGTNTGPFRGMPPSGRAIKLQGVDYLTIENGKVKSVLGYFDSAAVPAQLGMQVVVQPHEIGPFKFGTSIAVQSGKNIKPGAFSITQIINYDNAELEETRANAREVTKEMMGMQGFIGLMTGRVGNRGVTISAWENADQPRQLLTSAAHSEAMRKFFSGYDASAYTSVWVPARINDYYLKCQTCGKVSGYEKQNGVCNCGSKLPEPPPYW